MDRGVRLHVERYVNSPLGPRSTPTKSSKVSFFSPETRYRY